MQNFTDKIAVVTGAGTGMGRELALQLADAGAHLGLCDLSPDTLEETAALVKDQSPACRIATHLADVSTETDLVEFRDAVTVGLQTNHVHLLFNNAGVAGGGSLFTDNRDGWDRTFAVTWGGVYLGTRVFLPLLVAADEAAIINTSSVNGFYASMGPDRPHTAYSAAKFAVKGFTEALITDLALNAPHVRAHLVMPGHIRTKIVANSMRHSINEPTAEEAELMLEVSKMFEDRAPMTAAEAAKVILDGVRNDQWRILVGDDAVELDQIVRADPEHAYDKNYFNLL